MRQQEAEQEAARRNAEDERRDRFLFYPLDHSAGMGDDAWEVEMRLRTADDDPVAAAVPVAAAAPAEAADPGPEPLAEADALPATQPFAPIDEVEPAEPVPPAEPVEAIDELPPAVRATEVDEPPAPRRPRRRLRLIHVWGAFVILVGLLFIGATLLLSVVLRDYTHFGVIPTSIGIGLGLVAVWVGVALARTG
jgi:hypothetical protein